jgi:DNA primase
VPLFLAAGLDAKIATLPPGSDPDSVLLEQGRATFDKILDRAVPAIDYILAELQGEMEDTVVGRARVLERIAPLVAKLESRVARDLYGDRLAMALGVDRTTVDRAIAGQRPRVPAAAPAAQPGPGAAGLPDPAELDPLGILVEHPHLFARAEQAGLVSLLTSDDLRATYSAAVAMQKETGAVAIPRLLQATSPDIRDAVAQMVLSGKYAADGDPTRALDDCVLALRRRSVDRRLRDEQAELAAAQSRGDSTMLGQLREQLIELIEERRRAY